MHAFQILVHILPWLIQHKIIPSERQGIQITQPQISRPCFRFLSLSFGRSFHMALREVGVSRRVVLHLAWKKRSAISAATGSVVRIKH